MKTERIETGMANQGRDDLQPQRPALFELEVGRKPGAEAVFFIRDDGVGFDPAYAGRLFQPFQRMHASSDFEGTGIGLAIVQRVINRHAGRVLAESAIDQGTTLFFVV